MISYKAPGEKQVSAATFLKIVEELIVKHQFPQLNDLVAPYLKIFQNEKILNDRRL